jgi:hypothetical protein
MVLKGGLIIMKKIFRKAITVLGSAALIGATVGAASAAAFPAPFTSNTAVVYGANAAQVDMQAAMDIVANLDSASAGSSVTTLSGASGVTEDQISLQGHLVTGKISDALTDSKIPSLIDTKISWDDGGASGSDDFNVHEEIRVGTMAINTTLDDNDYTGLLAMTNDKTLEYRYVFETAFANASAVGQDTADDLYLTILGKQYEIDAVSATSITVVTSEQISANIGESVTVDGKTFTVDDVFSADAQINGELISTGATKKIDGMRVKVKSIGYHSNAPELSKVILQIGEDISKSYSNGEAFVGEDTDDPSWIWQITDIGTANNYIGVKYNQKETRDTDDVVYEGGSFIFPNDFAAVTFDGLTEGISYTDYKVYFDDAEDLWNSTDLTSTAQVTDAPVLIIEAVDGANDAIKLTNGSQETDKVYIRIAQANDEGQDDLDNTALEIYYSDVDSTVQDSIRPRFLDAFETTANATLAATDLGDLIFGDSTIAMTANMSGGGLNLTFTDGGTAQNITLNIGGEAVAAAAGELKWFGGFVEATDKEDGVSTDMMVNGVAVGVYDNDIITSNGLIVEAPEGNLDNEQVIISIPDDRVYATVSVVAGGSATTTGEAGALLIKDTALADAAGMNLVVVGGSAINAAAAELLGGAFDEADFMAETGVAAGEFLLQSFSRSGKTALLVAGYDAADTENAAAYLLNVGADTAVGTKLKGVSATEATVVTA